jgi:alpha-glucosidase
VEHQEHDPGSLLHHYRRAIAFRRNHRALIKGEYENLGSKGDIFFFTRAVKGQRIFCAFNLSGEPSAMEMPEGRWLPIAAELGTTGPAPDGKLHMGPWQPCFLLQKS